MKKTIFSQTSVSIINFLMLFTISACSANVNLEDEAIQSKLMNLIKENKWENAKIVKRTPSDKDIYQAQTIGEYQDYIFKYIEKINTPQQPFLITPKNTFPSTRTTTQDIQYFSGATDSFGLLSHVAVWMQYDIKNYQLIEASSEAIGLRGYRYEHQTATATHSQCTFFGIVNFIPAFIEDYGIQFSTTSKIDGQFNPNSITHEILITRVETDI